MVEVLASLIALDLAIVEVWGERAGGMPAADSGTMVHVQSFRLRRFWWANRGCWRTPGYWLSRLRRREEGSAVDVGCGVRERGVQQRGSWH